LLERWKKKNAKPILSRQEAEPSDSENDNEKLEAPIITSKVLFSEELRTQGFSRQSRYVQPDAVRSDWGRHSGLAALRAPISAEIPRRLMLTETLP